MLSIAVESTDALGVAAATLTTAAFVPQVVKVWRSQSAEDLSISMLLVFSLGLALWLAYGIRIGSSPVIAANAVTLALNLAILALKRRYDRRG